MLQHSPVPLAEIEAARRRLAGVAFRTPLLRLDADDAPAEIYLKLENLQITGAFKLRGAYNAISLREPGELAAGVWTGSAGNMGLGVAWSARRLGIPCTVLVPDDAPPAKLAALERLGARLVKVPFAEFLATHQTRHHDGIEGCFIHAFSDRDVMAGNGTIGMEILEDLPDVDAVVVPYGGGGLSCGIASAVRGLRPEVKVYAAEAENGAPLAPSLAAGRPVEVTHRLTFISGIGAPYVFPEMWPLASRLLDGSLVAALPEVVAAIRLLAERHHVVAEGAGAVGLAAALAGKAGGGKIVCVISGGNLDAGLLARILEGETP